jgi:beta-aspartyl-peptidase (threonine type)
VLEQILSRASTRSSLPDELRGTVNVLAQDRAGRLASAVSTSGWAWKYPGRVGDSPLIGAGNYADDRYGAAACTGYGELAIRTGTARSVVLLLQAGRSLEDACTAALDDLATLDVDTPALTLSLVALDRHGNHCAVSTSPEAFYLYQADGMGEPAKLRRRTVNPRGAE